MQSKNAIGNLKNRYLAVLKKCNLMNVFGSLAMAGALLVASAGIAEAFNQARSESAYEVTSGVAEGDPNYYTTFTIQENGVDTTYGVKFTGSGAPASFGATENIQTLVKDYLVSKIKIEQGAVHNYTITLTDPNTFNLTFDGKTAIISENPTTGEVIVNLQGNSTGNRNTSSPNNIYQNFIGNTGLLNGGAVFNNNAHDIDTIEGDFIKNSVNSLEGKGGAIYNIEGGTIRTITGDFISNSAVSGGAIYTALSALLLNIDGDFIANEASYGGAIYTDGANIDDIVGDFLANTAKSHGGAIYSSNSEITSIEGDFIGNSAQLGGAIYNTADNQTNSIITNLIADFMNNIAFEGGAIYNDSQIKTLRADFIGNTANGDGGAIYNVGDIGSITGNFFNNSSTDKGGAIYTTKSLNFSAVASSRFISGNSTSSAGAKDYNAIYVDGADVSINFNLNSGGSYTLDDNIRGNGVNKYTVNITSGDIGSNTFYLNNALHGVGLVTVNNILMTLGSGTFGSGVIEDAKFEQTGGLVQVNDGGVLNLNGGFIAGEAPSGGVLSINSGGSLIITSGTFDVGRDSTLIVDSGATKFAIEEKGELLFGLDGFGSINQDGTYRVNSSIGKKLDNEGNLALIVDFITMDYTDYNNFLTDFRTNAMIGSGTVELKDVGITTTNTYLKNILDGASMPNNVVLGADSINPDGGTFAAGRTAVLGGVNGNVTNNGTLTLTGEGDAAGELVNGNLVNNNIINLGAGSISGEIYNAGTVNIAGNLTVNTMTSSAGASVDTINVKNNAIFAVDTFNSDYSTIITVGEDTDGMGATLLTTGEVRFADSTVHSFNKWQGTDDIREASASIYNKIFNNAITSNFIVAQNSYALFGEGNRANVEDIFSESQYTWGSDVTAAIFFASPHRLGDDSIGGSIIVDGSAIHINAANVNSAVFAADSLFVVNATGVGENAALTATNGKLTVDADAKLYVTGAVSGDTIAIVKGFNDAGSSIAAGGWDETNLTSSSALQIAKVADFDTTTGSYSVKISANSTEDLLKSFPLMQLPTANLMPELAKVADVNSPQDSIALLSRAMDDSFLGRTNSKLAISTMEGLFQLGAISGTASTGYQLINTFGSTLQARADSANSNQEIYSESLSDYQNNGLSAGSEQYSINNGFAVWATPLYSHTHASGRNYGAFESGYSSDLAGITLGSDYTFNNQYRLGLAMNVGAGSLTSNGDFNKTTNDFDFLGVSLYGSMFLNDFTITADMGYTAVNNDVKNEIPTQLQMADIKSDIDSQIFTIGVTGEYTFETQHVDITPHAGIRYTNIHTDNYNTTSNGGIITQTASDNQGIVSIPVGVTFSKDIVTESGWAITPKADIGVVASFGDMEATSRTSIPSVIGTATYKTDNIDSFAFKGGVGVEVAKENLSFGLNYDLQASKHETSHGVNVGFTYKF